MSVDYTTSLVYGVAVKMKQIPITVTRYHEVTGKPYEKTIHKYKYVVDNTNIIFPQNDFSDELIDQLEDDQNMSLGVQNGYFGIRLASVNPAYAESVTITTDMLEDAEKAFEQLVADTFPEHPQRRNVLLSNGQLLLTGLAW